MRYTVRQLAETIWQVFDTKFQIQVFSGQKVEAEIVCETYNEGV
jgi:hypothetical protein